MAVQGYLRTHWALLTGFVVAAAFAVVVLLIIWTMPPRTLIMATGPEGGGYHEIGKRYQHLLARSGVRLRLVPTDGAVENLVLLRDPRSGVSLALLQGGTTTETDSPEIESLGTVFYEPLWLFHRVELKGLTLDGLRGRKVSVGAEGSGTRKLALELLKRRGIDERSVELLRHSPQTASERLLAGEIDAAFVLASWESPAVRALMADDRVELARFPNIEAYLALYPFLSKVTVPAGVGDLSRNRPPADVTLFAPKASLVVRDDLHSAIQFLLLNTAVQIHSGPGIFRRAGEFPAAEAIDVPLSADAIQFYKTGRPFLQNYLPFWIASLAGRLFVILIPVLGVLYPLLRLAPAVYGWMMQRKIARLYGELRILERELAAQPGKADGSSMMAQFDDLEEQANSLQLPAAYASMLYTLRNHVALVRERLTKLQSAPQSLTQAKSSDTASS